jgi:uncharacterized membrane protein YeaQ/YmgE (transglycosylase-associated protein family)
MVFGTVCWILVGAIAGVLIEWTTPGVDPSSIIVTILIGIAGGLMGGFVSAKLGLGSGDIHNLLVATACANLLLILDRVKRAQRA